MGAGPRVGAEWAGFAIESQIGEGGYGRVFAAWDPVLERRVALKVLHRPGLAIDDAARERFLRESRIAAGLDHPRIVAIHAAAEHPGDEPGDASIPYLVMRYVDGGDLRGALRQGPLSLARTQDVVSQIADALDRAHRSGLVHRDVKPANILCAADSGDVYLGDFGITRWVDQPADASLTVTGAVPASPHYAAPEQLVPGQELGPRADVYALACTAFECLTGRVPFPGANQVDVAHQHLHAPRPSVTEQRPDLPVALDGIIARAMAVDPDERDESAGSFAAALAAVSTRRAGSTPIPPPGAPVGPPLGIDDATRLEVPTGALPAWSDPAATGQGPPVPAQPDRAEPDRPPLDPTRPGLRDAVPVGPHASVFDVPVAPPTGSAPPPATADDATRTQAAVGTDPAAGPPGPGLVEVEWDDVEDDRPRSRLPWIVGGVLLVATVVVGALVVRAINTDADLVADARATTTTVAVTTPPEPPTEERLRALLPEGLDSCVPPAETESGAAEGDRIRLVCPREGAPQLVQFVLFSDTATRDQAFADTVASLEVDPARAGECALADDVVHAYTGDGGTGRVACRRAGSRIDVVWTRGDAPVLATAGGNGFFGDVYRFWADAVERSDATFPLPVEQALLSELPPDLLEECRRDIDLTDQAPGVVAVACAPELDDGDPSTISWVRFADAEVQEAWIRGRLDALAGAVVDTTDDACTKKGFGERDRDRGRDDDDDDDDDDEEAPAAPPPDAGFTTWDEGGSSGRILCFVNSSGQNVVFWTRDDAVIGSIAVSSTDDGDMGDLLEWFRKDGYAP